MKRKAHTNTWKLVALFQNSHEVPSLLRVHVHLLSFDRERYL